jgi:hypothetical protein
MERENILVKIPFFIHVFLFYFDQKTHFLLSPTWFLNKNLKTLKKYL